MIIIPGRNYVPPSALLEFATGSLIRKQLINLAGKVDDALSVSLGILLRPDGSESFPRSVRGAFASSPRRTSDSCTRTSDGKRKNFSNFARSLARDYVTRTVVARPFQ